MAIGLLSLHLWLPACKSLKEKRGHIKPLIHRIHREFNVSVVEMGLQDKWTESLIAAAVVCNDSSQIHAYLNSVISFLGEHFCEIEIVENHIEIM